MQIIVILIKRLAFMFLFMIIGAVLYKKKKISEEGSKSLANLLIWLVLPTVIINAFIVDRTPERIKALLLSFVVSVILLAISIIVSRILFKKSPIEHFASAFSNPGFFGIPIIIAILDQNAVFYIASYIACLNIMQWTYGVAVLKEDKIERNLKQIILSPFMIAFFIGLLLFFTQIKLPVIVKDVISSSASINTPIAMLISGIYLAKVDIKKMLLDVKLYKLAFTRLLIIPVISLAVIIGLPNNFYELKLCLLIASACPTGTNVAVYAQLHNKDYVHAVETVVLSTLLSVATIPLIVYLFQQI